MITEVGTLVHNTLLSNMYYDNRSRHSLPTSKLKVTQGYITYLGAGGIVEEITVFVAFIHHCDRVLRQSSSPVNNLFNMLQIKKTLYGHYKCP